MVECVVTNIFSNGAISYCSIMIIAKKSYVFFVNHNIGFKENL